MALDGHHERVTAAAPDPAAAPAGSILRCTACGAQARALPTDREPPRCPSCGAFVPWLVAALADTFDDEVAVALPVLVDFWAAWCTPCRLVTPMVARAAKEHAGRLKVVKVNVDRVPEIGDRFKLLTIPSLAVLVGGREVDRVTGAIPPAALEDVFAPYLAPLPAP